MTDLLYFGYEWDKDAQILEQEFIEAARKEFPEIKFKDAFNSIKGYRQEVHLPEEKKDNYFAWMISDGWSGCSLPFQIQDIEECKRLFALAKTNYPHAFRS